MRTVIYLYVLGASAFFLSCEEASPPPQIREAMDAAGRFTALETLLMETPGIELEFHITSEGAFEADLEGALWLGEEGFAELKAVGEFGGESVDLFLRSEGGEYEYGNGPDREVAPSPEHLREALGIGFSRMGLLHNLAMLVGNAPPDRAQGGVRDWVVADSFGMEEPEGGGGGPLPISFYLTVGGAPAGSAVLSLDSNGYPMVRRQTVEFPDGEMKVVEGITPLRFCPRLLGGTSQNGPVTPLIRMLRMFKTGGFPRLPLARSLVVALAMTLSALPGVLAQSRGQAGPVFENGQAQVVPAFEEASQWIQEELWVETEFDSDGDGKPDRVHVAVTRPGQTETEGLKVPVVYESSPYFAGTAPGNGGYFWDVRQDVGETPPTRGTAPQVRARIQPGISKSQVATWVPRGFAVVHSEAPGTGLSEGCPTVGGPPEILAPKAVIDWLNGRARGFTSVDGNEEVSADWSTGKVGMTGTSYNGTIPVAAATTGVEGLEAIIPVAPNNSYYRYYRSNGLVQHPGGWLGEDIDVLYDFINSGDPQGRAWCDANVREGELAAGHDRASGDYNDFWAARDLMNELDGIRAATLTAHGFNDWNVMPEHTVKVYEFLRAKGVPAQAYFHQGGHGGAPPLELMNRWFTRYLYGIENGVENDPKAWIVREGADRNEPTPYADYPNPEASPVTLYPRAGGVQVGDLSLSSAAGQGTETLVDNFSFGGASLARAEWTNHRLLFSTPELSEAIHVSGTPRITIRLASDQPAANLSIWLVSLPWTEGRVVQGGVITRGWADPQNHSSLTEGEPLVPGQFYDLAFELQPDDQIIPAGQRLGLMIFSSDREFTLWPPPGTELTVDLDGTALELPVVGGAAALRRATGGGE